MEEEEEGKERDQNRRAQKLGERLKYDQNLKPEFWEEE